MEGAPELKSTIQTSPPPEIQHISREELRERVVLAWVMALRETSFKSLGEFGQFKAAAGVSAAEHMRGVAAIALGITRAMKDTLPDLSIDMDVVAAGVLCHDLGKPFKYDPGNQAKWQQHKWRFGNPAIRHPVYGTHVALNAGLPPEVVHIVSTQSMEGSFVERSIEATIVHYADLAFWDVALRGKLGKSLFQVTGGTLKKELD